MKSFIKNSFFVAMPAVLALVFSCSAPEAITDNQYSNTFFTLKSDLKRDEYSLIGWTDTKDSTSTDYCLNDHVYFSKDKTLFAKWKKPDYAYSLCTITLEHGFEGPEPINYNTKIGTYFRIPGNPFTREGYSFCGWSNPVISSAIYPPYYKITSSTTTFTANWVENDKLDTIKKCNF